ncbi:hypothetical protein ACR9E3_03295 [Actinomycetospora sp. C-140]
MDDERLLAEALRAHAAGGVSSPGGTSTPPSTEQTDEEADADSGGSRLRDRFRPLTRNRKGADEAGRGPEDAASDVTQTTARPDPSVVPPAPPRPTGPTPAPGFPAAGRPGPSPARPAPRPAAGTAAGTAGTAGTGERPWPRTGPPQPARPGPPVGPGPRPGTANVPHPRPAPGAGPTGAIPAARPGGTDRDAPAPWTPARIAWWSGMALLAGAVAGALAAVGTLGLPS